jgi:hypothetical protein
MRIQICKLFCAPFEFRHFFPLSLILFLQLKETFSGDFTISYLAFYPKIRCSHVVLSTWVGFALSESQGSLFSTRPSFYNFVNWLYQVEYVVGVSSTRLCCSRVCVRRYLGNGPMGGSSEIFYHQKPSKRNAILTTVLHLARLYIFRHGIQHDSVEAKCAAQIQILLTFLRPSPRHHGFSFESSSSRIPNPIFHKTATPRYDRPASSFYMEVRDIPRL